ncbi:S41 family peptidase [Wenjunlia tyrosinilytica]|uniref:Peptidase S41 n=1 Tax=Wenjunlia tyrosinilytica TaxID=1544741 RepID=A0A917ZXE6_9ACTN|nr:S41 family peptidase [Wenjunlia tyrosinilytica]GGO97448.1 peptidase S41 [Wenjunlia tyrosinilytica]
MSGPSLFGRPRRYGRGAALTFVFGAVLAAGAATGAWGDRSAPSGSPVRLSADATTVNSAPAKGKALSDALAEKGLGPEDARELVSRSGDRWAAFYTEREFEGFQRTLDGQYVGVGLWVRRMGDGRTEVARVQPGSPAARGGVRVGDRLTRVGGTDVYGRPVTEVVALLRGGEAAAAKPGSTVVLGLERDGRASRVALRRALMAAQDVSVEHLGHDVTRIKVDSFTRGVGRHVREALRGRSHRGVMLDLRGNSGGLVSEANETASAFLDGGLVATYDVDGEQHALFAEAGGDTATPLVVLVDGNTMSAAEMLAGALQDRSRAVVVGSRTFGKGSVQEPRTLPDGSVVERTVGTYRTPSGRTVDAGGVRPDVTVDTAKGSGAAKDQALTVLGGLAPRS